MTGIEPAHAIAPRVWWTRPGRMLPLVGSVLLLVALLTPEATNGRFGDARLSSHISGSMGARVLADLAARLGWRIVMRDSMPVPSTPAGGTVHAVLAPPMRMTAAQAHRYLDAVRGGDALLIALDERNPLADSLGLWRTRDGGELVVAAADSAACGARRRDITPPLWPDGRAHLWALRWVRGAPASTVTFARVGNVAGRSGAQADTTVVTAAGFAVGRGRVAVVADPDLLRNDVLRRCAHGADVVAVRLLEYLRAGGDVPRAILEFDEYHQGYGPAASVGRVVRRFLATNPVGRTILQTCLAALLLLLAVAPRAMVPRPRGRVERRDPLEQVDALAHAYEQVGATRTATARLLRGLRTRVERGSTAERARADDAVLDAALAADPARSADVSLVRRALRASDAHEHLPEIGAALRRIEAALTTTFTRRA